MKSKVANLELENKKENKKGLLSWIKRLGFAGFMFFLIKGLVWVAVFIITFLWGPDALQGIKDFFANLF